jgi:thiol-disulfide isomerase/thioredoxin
MYSQHIDTFLINGKFDLYLDNVKPDEYTIAIIYPKSAGRVEVYRDENGKVIAHKIKYAAVTLFKMFYINPSQATDYHFTSVSNVTTEMMYNYFYETDNYKSNTFGITIASTAKDTKLYDEFENLKNDFKGEKLLKILDSLFKNSTKPDKIYWDFDSIARKINYQQNFNKYFSSFTSIVQKNLNTPISALAMLDLSKNDFESKKGELSKLLNGMDKIDKQNDYYSRALLRLKEIDDPLVIGKHFINPQGKTPEMKEFSFNASSNKYTLVEFWASWCLPCRQKNPALSLILDEYQNKGFQILGVSLDGNLKNWRNAIKQENLEKWIHVSDLPAGNNLTGRNALKYKIESIPTNVLIDSNGMIVAKNIFKEDLMKFLNKNL